MHLDFLCQIVKFWSNRPLHGNGCIPSVDSPWTQWTLSGWSIGTKVHGQCPLSPWTLSTESMDNIHWVHGHCPLNPWTLSTESMDNVHQIHGQCPPNPWTMSTQSLNFFPGFSLHFIKYRIIAIQPNWMHTSSSQCMSFIFHDIQCLHVYVHQYWFCLFVW